MKNFGIKQIGFHQAGTVKGGLQPQNYSGTWGNRGKGNELQTGLEKGLSWIWDKVVNADDYINDGLNYLITTPLAAITGKTKEVPRVVDLMRELRHIMSLLYAMNPAFDLISPIKGGWMLKGLMKGSPLEKQLSKIGTININGLLAYLNKASKLELDVIGTILNTKFAGQKNIDYNALRKAVSEELISYSRVPQLNYADYGADRLRITNPTPKQLFFGERTIEEGLNPTFNTFTFESSRIPVGNGKHYDTSTLGHSRTYTTPDEPDVLHVMESLSDWGLSKYVTGFDKEYDRLSQLRLQVLNDFGENADVSYHDAKLKELESKLTKFNPQQEYLKNNYVSRLIQENMKYAAEQGLKRMRYPTPDTAAKIEGYKKTYPEPEYSMLKLKSEAYLEAFENGTISYDRYLELSDGILKRLREIQGLGLSYSPEHQTILKKYADFPKIFNKLFKGLEVRTVTDPKGNTWYEVDIPENFLQSEWLFKKGGVLGLNKIIGFPYLKKGSKILIKKKNRGKFTEYCGGKVTDECILRAKKSGNSKLVKRAVFALNARSWSKK